MTHDPMLLHEIITIVKKLTAYDQGIVLAAATGLYRAAERAGIAHGGHHEENTHHHHSRSGAGDTGSCPAEVPHQKL